MSLEGICGEKKVTRRRTYWRMCVVEIWGGTFNHWKESIKRLRNQNYRKFKYFLRFYELNLIIFVIQQFFYKISVSSLVTFSIESQQDLFGKFPKEIYMGLFRCTTFTLKMTTNDYVTKKDIRTFCIISLDTGHSPLK